MNIDQTLGRLGLDEKEVRVYLALLEQGKARPSVLAKTTGLNRSTLYLVAKSLVSKGLVTEDLGGTVLHFTALPPESLSSIVDQSRRELQEKEVLAQRAITALQGIVQSRTYTVPKIQLIQEEGLKRFLFSNTERWQKAVIESDGIWWGYQDQSFAEHYEEWVDATWTTSLCSHEHYKPQFFSNIHPVEKRLDRKYKKRGRTMKYIDNAQFTANTWVCGNFLVLIMTREHPHYLIEINDALIADNTREMLRILWERTS